MIVDEKTTKLVVLDSVKKRLTPNFTRRNRRQIIIITSRERTTKMWVLCSVTVQRWGSLSCFLGRRWGLPSHVIEQFEIETVRTLRRHPAEYSQYRSSTLFSLSLLTAAWSSTFVFVELRPFSRTSSTDYRRPRKWLPEKASHGGWRNLSRTCRLLCWR